MFIKPEHRHRFQTGDFAHTFEFGRHFELNLRIEILKDLRKITGRKSGLRTVDGIDGEQYFLAVFFYKVFFKIVGNFDDEVGTVFFYFLIRLRLVFPISGHFKIS